MKRSFKWLIAIVVIAALALGALHVIEKRRTQNQADANASPKTSSNLMELAASDVFDLKEVELTETQPISGSIRALNSVFIKARVAGELQGLTVREGDRVKPGQLIARVDPTDSQARLNQALEQANAARAQMQIAQRQLDDNQALVAQGFISKAALNTSQNNLQSAQANLAAAQASVDQARKTLSDTQLMAPIGGMVAQRLVQPGERVAVDTRIVEIVDLSRLELEASVSSAESLTIRTGQLAKLQIEGMGQALDAKVLRISPSAQAGNRAVLVYLGLESSSDALRQGMFAQGEIAISRSRGLAVPLRAVRTDRPEPYVQMIEQGKVMHRKLTLGVRGSEGGETLVMVQGLSPGSRILLGHVGALREGTPVKFTESAAPTSAVKEADAAIGKGAR